MADELSRPASIDALYLSRGENSAPHRPLMQGDVLNGISLPLFDGEAGLAIVLTHPCSMRAGPALRKTQLVCRVRGYQEVPFDQWDRHLRWMPLPLLDEEKPDTHVAACFEELTSVATTDLPVEQRIACLSPHGISLLQQRLTYYLTRLAPPLPQLIQVCAHVLEEADLLEEWVTASHRVGADMQGASEAFDAFITSSPEGDAGTWQGALRDPARRASARRASRETMNHTYPE